MTPSVEKSQLISRCLYFFVFISVASERGWCTRRQKKRKYNNTHTHTQKKKFLEQVIAVEKSNAHRWRVHNESDVNEKGFPTSLARTNWWRWLTSWRAFHLTRLESWYSKRFDWRRDKFVLRRVCFERPHCLLWNRLDDWPTWQTVAGKNSRSNQATRQVRDISPLKRWRPSVSYETIKLIVAKSNLSITQRQSFDWFRTVGKIQRRQTQVWRPKMIDRNSLSPYTNIVSWVMVKNPSNWRIWLARYSYCCCLLIFENFTEI